MTPYHLDDTICAIATAAGGAARGMIRISGRDAVAIASRCFEAEGLSLLDEIRQPTAVAGRVSMEIERKLPCVLFLWPGQRSYTREPVAELHTIGSPPLLEALLATVCRAGARLAEPGEFTLRAFLAGRLDLTQAEGVLGVIDARGSDELQAALAQLAGGLARPLHQLRDELLQLLAELEAGLDFAHEDIEFVASDEIGKRLEAASHLLSGMAEQMASRHTSGKLPQIVLFGEPNVGKSSLFNALVARCGYVRNGVRRAEVPALVSAERGTTRDYLTSPIELDGLECELVDTAGIGTVTSDIAEWASAPSHEAIAAISSAAAAKASERRARAAIRVYCIDASRKPHLGGPRDADCDLIVWTKVDLASPATYVATTFPISVPVAFTSSHTGAGLDDFCRAIRELLMNDAMAQHGQVVGATAERCRESICLAAAALERAREIAFADGGDELIAAELRTALSELGKVVGTVYTDDLLDRIFRTFCIGK